MTPAGSKSWVFIWTQEGKRREMGLGSYPDIGLAKARDCRTAVDDGRDPIADREREAEPTFSECVDKFLASMEKQWRNEKHRAQWRMTLTVYCAAIKSRKVSTIKTEDVLKILKPIWQEKAETAARLRGRIERVLDFAKARAWREGENPALWRGHLKNVLPVLQKLARGHHAAMPFMEVPAFMKQLDSSGAVAARALELLILTASRSGEVMGATWEEIDLEARLWTVPAIRMKAGREHRVPLGDAAMAVLRRVHHPNATGIVFEGFKEGKPISNMAMTILMRRMDVGHFTVHGFRSAFRDWAGDKTSFSRELAEAALAHTVGDMTERAYRRSDAVEKRRHLMKAWADYCKAPGGKVIALAR